MLSVLLYRIDRAKNMQRFYRLDIQPDLFGNLCLIREFGRIGKPGQLRSVPYSIEDKAMGAFRKHRTAKERRGYLSIQG